MIANERIELRAPERDDVESIFMAENDRDKYESSPSPQAPVSHLQVWEYVNSYAADPFGQGELRLMIVDRPSGRTVGIIDLTQVDGRARRAAVGIYIFENFRRQGYAAAAVELMCAYAADTLDLHQLWAMVAVDNRPSVALFDKCAFKSAGRLRSWVRSGRQYRDVLVFQRLFGG